VIVHNLDVFGVAARPAKTDAELIVHPQAPLACPIALQLLKPVGRRRAQVFDASRPLADSARPRPTFDAISAVQ
jgi:hypothetical protein